MLLNLSGGLDSAVIAASGGCEAGVFWRYGQDHEAEELAAAREIAECFALPLLVRDLPTLRRTDDVVWGARNGLMCFASISLALEQGISSVGFGCNASDWLRFPDCRPAFWKSMRDAAEAYGVRVATPLLHMMKREVVRRAMVLGVPIKKTWSCYHPREGKPCGGCLACTTRKEALND